MTADQFLALILIIFASALLVLAGLQGVAEAIREHDKR